MLLCFISTLYLSIRSASDGELFTLETIRSGIRFQRSVAEGWIKVSVFYYLPLMTKFDLSLCGMMRNLVLKFCSNEISNYTIFLLF